MINRLPLTRIKISIAHFLFRVVSLFYSHKNTLIVRKRKGIYYELDLREGLDLSMFLFGKFQSHTINSPLLKIPKDAIILDIGGNFGFMALQYAQKAPDGKVFSFEPTHYAVSRFKRNLELNPELSRRISLVNMFVSSKASKDPRIKVFSSWRVDSIKNTDGSRHPVHLGVEKSTDGVDSITLDGFCKSHKIKKVDLIKIDTDGHEAEVLEGAKKIILQHRPVVVFEVGKYVMIEKGLDISHYLDYFESFNYKLFNAKTGKSLDRSNWNALIPQLGTIDVIALPDENKTGVGNM